MQIHVYGMLYGRSEHNVFFVSEKTLCVLTLKICMCVCTKKKILILQSDLSRGVEAFQNLPFSQTTTPKMPFMSGERERGWEKRCFSLSQSH